MPFPERFALIAVLMFSSIPGVAQENPSTTQSEQAKAIAVITRVADSIRQCAANSQISQTKGNKPLFYRFHSGPPTSVRFDLKQSDSLVAPYVGIVEFSIHTGTTHYWRTPAEAEADNSDTFSA